MRNKVTEADKKAIREYNETLTGNVKERCRRLMYRFGYCHQILSNIIRKEDNKRQKRDTSKLTKKKVDEIKKFILSIEGKKSDLNKMTRAVKEFNRSITDIREIYTSMKDIDSVVMFDCKQEFHGFI